MIFRDILSKVMAYESRGTKQLRKVVSSDEMIAEFESKGYRFRKARQSDAKPTLRLLHQMFIEPPHGFNEKNALRTIRRLDKWPVYHLVVERDGAPIASALAYFIRYARFGSRMFIEDFVVDKSHRGMGIGTAMLDYLKLLAARKGCTGLVLHTGKSNTAAQKFYMKNGMQGNVMFKLDLPEMSK